MSWHLTTDGCMLRILLASVPLLGATFATFGQGLPRPDLAEASFPVQPWRPSTPAGPRVLAAEPATDAMIVAAGGLSELRVAFTEPVVVPPGAVSVSGIFSGEVLIERVDYDPVDLTLTITLDDAPIADVLTLVIDYSVRSPDRKALDGEIADPDRAAFPSGDGVAGGQSVLRYRVLQGDANRDGTVDDADAIVIQSALGLAAGQPGFDPRADLNGDGVVNVLDVVVWSGGFGLSLPPVGTTPVQVIGITPDPTVPIDRGIDAVAVNFSAPVARDSVTAATLYLVDSSGLVQRASSATIAPSGLLAEFRFAKPVICGRFRVGLSNAIRGLDGALLLRPDPTPRYDSLFPPPVPQVGPIASPVGSSAVRLSGFADRAAAVEVSGPGGTVEVPTDSGAFSLDAPLRSNANNPLFVTAISACGGRSAPQVVQVVSDTTAPTLHVDFPAADALIEAETTDVAGRVSDLLSGFAGLDVFVNGVAAEVDEGIGTNGTFFLPGVALSATGPTPITVTARDALGNSTSKTISVQRRQIPADAARMQIIAGNAQTGPIGSFLPSAAAVRVVRLDDTPVVGKVVEFHVARSDGVLFAPGQPEPSQSVQVLTNADGVAATLWQLGTDAGCGNNRVEVTSRDIAGTIVFCASAEPGPAFQINVGSGNMQRSEAGAPALFPLRAFVSDSCNGVADLPVRFEIVEGDGTFPNGLSTIIVPTARTGHAETTFNLGPTPGQNRVRATFDGNPNAPAEFILTGLARVEDAPTSFSGLVIDNCSQPIEGAVIRLVINGQEIGTTLTDIDGLFDFPAFQTSGRTDLYVDGTVATGVGGRINYSPVPPFTFPTLHFETNSVAAAENSLGMPAQLPRMNPNNLRSYSTTQQTILECEGVDGLRMVIEPGSMTLADGTPARDGQVMALNQVHHDNIPMPMPDGAAPPFAWTIFPPEATFDPPIRVEYPNMSGLPPGAVAYFLTFDHATGKFEIMSSGTVTPEGDTIVTDPGSGLTLSGWGCNCPPYSVTGECSTCAGQDLWQLTTDALTVGADVLLAIFDVRTAVQCALDAAIAVNGCLDAWSDAIDDDDLTQDEINSILACAVSIKSAVVTCTDALPEPTRIASRAQRISTAIGSAIDLARNTGCLDDEVDRALEVLAFFNDRLNSLLQWITTFTDKQALLRASCDKLELVIDAISLRGGGPDIDAIDAAFAAFEADWLASFQWDDQLLAFGASSNEWIAMTDDAEAVLDDIDTLPEVGGFALSVAGQAAIANTAGGFAMSNIAAPDSFGPDGPGTVPDFLSDDFLRVTGTAEINGRTWYAWSEPFQITQDQTYVVQDIRITDVPPRLPKDVQLDVCPTCPDVIRPGETVQLRTTADFADGSNQDITPRSAFTVYRTSNPSVATVDADGLVTGVAGGMAMITAVNEAATATRRILVDAEPRHTEVVGVVLLPDGSPAAGARVEVVGQGLSGTAGADGSYRIAGVSSTVGALTLGFGLVDFFGSLVGLEPVEGRLTDAGVVTLELPLNTSGRDFVLAFERNFDNAGVSPQVFVASTGPAALVRVDITGLGYVNEFTVPAGGLVRVTLPSAVVLNANNGIETRVARVISSQDVVVYGLNQAQATTDAFAGLPIAALGTEYMVMATPSLNGDNNRSQFAVVAVEDATLVTITPRVSTQGRVGGVPFTVLLNTGQAYQLRGDANGKDLTGSTVSSTKPVAVFSGNSCATVPVGFNFCDHVVEQIPPTAAWGREAITVSLASRTGGDTIRVLAAEDGTAVKVTRENGSVQMVQLNSGQFTEGLFDGRTVFRSDRPILVAQFANGGQFDNRVGDPFMAIVPPFEQFLQSYTFSTPAAGFSTNFVNVLAETSVANAGGVVLDGAPLLPSAFSTVPGTALSSARVPISAGTHRLAAAGPVGLLVYGFNTDDSYGYPGGFALTAIGRAGGDRSVMAGSNGDSRTVGPALPTMDAAWYVPTPASAAPAGTGATGR